MCIPDWNKKQRNGAKQLPGELKGKEGKVINQWGIEFF